MIFAKELEKTSIMYSVCFGLKITLMSDLYLELQDSRKFKICFYRVNNFAQQTKGYSPILTFKVSEFDETLKKLIHYGAQQEHNIQEQDNQKVVYITNN
ncbi:unnamed protein product (macronuclear) [Paramecium tetraurelia]|uniref:Uncharacterized protein n=1 Tax=Paramecium tetraurelia TaxID=5888 RepID=A0C3P8_PARTE|nr:uncharacterized protein GSPATT00034894001 [Paramecium tetraurelia]CAK65415.1 unnamed protein product [Paramecium tetraurelia]|eukprot:XP_001432812.1 hypothetical protein (macronuclear) [Paramecium tetraurelia strain d4-2]